MEYKSRQSKRQEYLTKFTLTLVFLGLFAAFIAWRAGRAPALEEFRFSALDLVLLALATFRLGRMIAYDLVMEPLRAPFARTVPDGSGAGDTVEPRGTGARYSLGQLLSCPICIGTWVAAFLVYALVAFPGPARIFLWFMAAVGAAEVLNALVEAFCWSGQLARAVSGKQYSWHTTLPPEGGDGLPLQAAPGIKEKQNGSPN